MLYPIRIIYIRLALVSQIPMISFHRRYHIEAHVVESFDHVCTVTARSFLFSYGVFDRRHHWSHSSTEPST